MKIFLSRLSNTLMVLGVLSFIAGVASLVWPSIGLKTLIALFSATLLTQGIFQIQSAFQHRSASTQWWVWAVMGLVNIVGGLLAFFNPGVTTVFLVWIVGTTWLATGAIQIYFAIRLRKEIHYEGWMALMGILSILAGLMMISNPNASSIVLVWLMAGYFLLIGVCMFFLGRTVKTWGNDIVRYFNEVTENS